MIFCFNNNNKNFEIFSSTILLKENIIYKIIYNRKLIKKNLIKKTKILKEY